MTRAKSVWLTLSFTALVVGSAGAQGRGPSKVEIRKTDTGYQLLVNHQPFFIKGAGLGAGSIEQLAAAGGNSLRTWGIGRGPAGATPMLDRAETNGIYVALGLEVSKERNGFNYDDPTVVARQLDRIKSQILRYKDHPALIIWVIGNELNLNAKNPKVWDAVNDISKMIHQVDTNHLTTTPLGWRRSPVAARGAKPARPIWTCSLFRPTEISSIFPSICGKPIGRGPISSLSGARPDIGNPKKPVGALLSKTIAASKRTFMKPVMKP